MCDYSIVVPAYNEGPMLSRRLPALLEAVGQITHLRGEVVVVDNNSTDDTGEMAQGLGARVVFEPVNQISRARNRGAAAAAGRYLIFVDADTSASRELIEAALAEFTSGCCCGGGTLIGTTDPTDDAMRRSLAVWNWVSRKRLWAAGSFIYCLREGWQAVGGFNEKVYAAEEIYFSKALRRWGRKRGLAFTILDVPVDTSMRKAEWYTVGHILWSMLRLVLCPFLLRFRRFCRMWYARPGDDSRSRRAR